MNDSAETQTLDPTPSNDGTWETSFSDGGLPPVEPQADPQAAAPKLPQTKEEIEANDRRLDEQARDKEGRFAKGRHRARSQQARAEDVPRIQELTRKLREKEREFEEFKAKATPAAEPKPIPRPNLRDVPKVEQAAFSDAEPKLDDFADQSDPYAAWLRAVSAYDRKKEEFDSRQRFAKERAEQTTQGNREEWQRWEQERQQDFGQRFQDFLLETQTSTEAMEAAVTAAESMPSMERAPALYWAILLGPNGPRHSLELAKQPELFDEFFEMAYGRPASQEFVEVIQRRLDRRLQAAQTTGSVAAVKETAPVVVKPAPRPPSPVRTAPIKVADGPPGDDSSLSDHESAWPTRRRR